MRYGCARTVVIRHMLTVRITRTTYQYLPQVLSRWLHIILGMQGLLQAHFEQGFLANYFACPSQLAITAVTTT